MRGLILFVALWLLALPLRAQQATLLADSLTIASGPALAAKGNVEVYFEGTTLSAAAILYDRITDRLQITGPIFIRTPQGDLLTADSASLDPRLRNGILRGARLVLDRQLQLAANRIDRVDGNLTQLVQVAATSCRICGDRAPLWEIRAARVIHDADAQQLYFEDAQLRVAGLPILWLPRMRLPDPTLTRATGFLVPTVRTTDQLGFGLRLPYFIKLGDHRDLTLTPYLSNRTTTLEARWRQAFVAGDLSVTVAASRDRLRPGEWRGLIFADGDFALAPGTRLQFAVRTVSDPAYLIDYGRGDDDRLESFVELARVRPFSLSVTRLTGFQSLREAEDFASLPPLVAGFGAEWRLFPLRSGGTLILEIGAEAFVRSAAAVGDPGRDVARLGAAATWRRDWLLPGGLLAEATTQIAADYVAIGDDPAYPDPVIRLTPAAQVALRWPLIRRSPGGASDLLEPVLALTWRDARGDPIPNEDSRLTEFDEANLLSLTRMPGEDGSEQGAALAAGLTWTRETPAGWQARLAFGRILRAEAADGFGVSSGLDGAASDWLAAGQLRLPDGFALTARTLIDASAAIGKTDARLSWVGQRIDLAAAYLWLPGDAAENRADPISEWSVDATYRLSDAWTITASGRYDVARDRPARAALGAVWQNECVTVDLSVARRYTETTTVEPATDFGLSVSLGGFSAGRSTGAVAATCRD